MKPKVFIDGHTGTTGLQIADRLGVRGDIDLLVIDDALRKDASARRDKLNSADVVILCLPDDAAREAVSLIENDATRVIDASTAHRTSPGWDYGFPELSASHRSAIASSRRVTNPGCHATGFVSIVYPLVELGLLPKDYPLTCFSLTGYSGGGKKMIEQYESEDKPRELFAPRIYGLNQGHKHLPEMIAVAGLSLPPIFCPIVDDYYKGMATSVTLHSDLLPSPTSTDTIREALAEYYASQCFITVSGNGGQTVITSRFDNLGKGASGAAVQNMNILLGLDESEGLI